MPGRVDVVLASEFVEAARMMERGFVSPNRTTLITSTSRTFATAEKIAMGDGRFEAARVEAAAARLAQRVIALDLDLIARRHATMVSATLFGALAGSGVLPWPRHISESAMGSGSGSAASLAGFAAAFAETASARKEHENPVAVPVAPAAERVAGLPAEIQEIAGHGLDRVTDFQDRTYGNLYLDRLTRLAKAAEPALPESLHALGEAARRLALWMAYEDVPRVADLKTRPERFACHRISEAGTR
jgi:indolepyruvate ferredoxin oxidoreductase beta subunit